MFDYLLTFLRNDTYAELPADRAFNQPALFVNALLHNTGEREGRRRETITYLGDRLLPRVLPDRPVPKRARELNDPIVADAVRAFLANEKRLGRLPSIVDVRRLSIDILVSILPLIYMRYANSADADRMLPFTYELIKASNDAHVAQRRLKRFLLCSPHHPMFCSRRNTSHISFTGWIGWAMVMLGASANALAVWALFYLGSGMSDRDLTNTNNSISLVVGYYGAILGMLFTGILGYFAAATAAYELDQISRYSQRIMDSAESLVNFKISRSASNQVLCDYLKAIDVPQLQNRFEIMTTQRGTLKVDELFFPLSDAIQYINFYRDGVSNMEGRAFRSQEFRLLVSLSDVERRVGDIEWRVAHEEAERITRGGGVPVQDAAGDAVLALIPDVPMAGAVAPVIGAIEMDPVSAVFWDAKASGLGRDPAVAGVENLKPRTGSAIGGGKLSTAKSSLAHATISGGAGQIAGEVARRLGYSSDDIVVFDAVATNVASVAYYGSKIMKYGRPDALLVLGLSHLLGPAVQYGAAAFGVDPQVALKVAVTVQTVAQFYASPVEGVVSIGSAVVGSGVTRMAVANAFAAADRVFGTAPAADSASSDRAAIVPR